MASLRQLFYVSRAAASVGKADVREILAVSKRNNWRRDVTGCLLFSGGHFAQTLEGSADALDPLLARLARDRRHHNVKVLLDREVHGRRFAQWSMAYLYRLDVVDELEDLLAGKAFTPADADALMRRSVADSVIGNF